ncbi:ATP-binding protein [Fictibacillus iocasae]|uniref:ATP-binding protein n=1 Tax=Fictibacillus iocasae TaxID=2715437 RepID=A0ABW2NN84_9BACL
MDVNSKVLEQTYVPAHLAIEAMRDNGYKNTAYAVAELIDNSIQADANCVELVCLEKDYQHTYKKMKRIEQIGILDNGSGMNLDVLSMALQFGNGTRLQKNQRSGMGRFGMGLPASSISQCKRVDVWSWQNGVESAIHTYLDIEEIKRTQNSAIPEPTLKEIPYIWREATNGFSNSGTLIVWSNLDRLMWSRGSTLIDNSENIIGRMYRKFLDEGSVKIRMATYDVEMLTQPLIDKQALPNDPLYLMKNTSCPAPFNNIPMFRPFGGENYEVKFTVDFQNEHHDIIVRISYASNEARDSENAGNTPHGKHASKNTGISIIRAGRELEIDKTLVLQSDPRERWWGVEIEFPPSLDELMGVTNNKQSARNLSDVLNLVDDIESLMRGGKTLNEIKSELEEEGDPRSPLIEVCHYVNNQIKQIRKLIKDQKIGSRANKRYDDVDAEKKATELTDIRKQKGLIGVSDAGEIKDPEEKQKFIEQELSDMGIENDIAKILSAKTISNNLKYLFAQAPLESNAFFTVRPCGGAINIMLNTRHPAYEHLIEVLEDDTVNCNQEQLIARLEKASKGLKLLLMAWARYEDELPDGDLKDQAKDARTDWGRIAKDFLKKY